MKNLFLAFSLALAACVLCGCPAPEEEEGAKPAIAFSGKPDARFVGVWKVTPGDMTYTFEESGHYIIDGTITNQGKKMKNHTEGQWSVDGDRFLIRDSQNNVVPYKYDLKNDSLTLALTGSMKAETKMVKQKG
jgi:hypothetical protein